MSEERVCQVSPEEAKIKHRECEHCGSTTLCKKLDDLELALIYESNKVKALRNMLARIASYASTIHRNGRRDTSEWKNGLRKIVCMAWDLLHITNPLPKLP